MEGLRKNTRNLTQNNWSPCQDLNRVNPKYKSETSSVHTLYSSQYWMLWLNYKRIKRSPQYFNKICEYENAHRCCLTFYSSYILLSLIQKPSDLYILKQWYTLQTTVLTHTPKPLLFTSNYFILVLRKVYVFAWHKPIQLAQCTQVKTAKDEEISSLLLN
jgi:hypothetical protein